MNNILELSSFFGSIILFFICYYQLRIEILNKDWMIFFWGGLIYFLCIPFFFDSSLFLFGDYDTFNHSYANENPTYWNGVNLHILNVAIFFTILFVLIYKYSDYFFYRLFKNNKLKVDGIYNFSSIGLFLLLIISLIPCLSILNDGADFIENQKSNIKISTLSTYTSVFLPLSSVMTYYCIIKKKYKWAIAFTLPLLAVSIIGQSRTLFFYIPAAYLMAYFQMSKKNIRIRTLSAILIILLLLSQSIKIIANDNYGFSEAQNKISFIVGKTFRDVSIGDFYFSVNIRENFPDLTTGGKSTIAVFLTGIIPPALADDIFNPQNTATYKIYQLRFGDVEYGSMHPTLVGYSFFDLGWFGIIIAIFLPFILRLYQKVTSLFYFSSFLSTVMISAFMFVALRGSLNVAYFRLIYGGITIFVILLLIYLFDSIFLEGKKRETK